MSVNKIYRLHSIVRGLLKEVSDISVENFSQVMWDLDSPHEIPRLRNLMRGHCQILDIELQPQVLEEEVVFNNVKVMVQTLDSDCVVDYGGFIKIWKSSWYETLTEVLDWCAEEMGEYVNSHWNEEEEEEEGL